MPISSRLRAVGREMLPALKAHQPRMLGANGTRPAAVLVPLWDRGDQVCMVFTKRTAYLPTHAGQISFPGGACDPQDRDTRQTALRETQEEIGVPTGEVEILACLDQMITITNYLVTPHLGLVGGGFEFEANPVEVERIIPVPLCRALDLSQFRQCHHWYQGSIIRQLALEHDGERIWGATARMVMNLIYSLGPAARQVIALSNA